MKYTYMNTLPNKYHELLLYKFVIYWLTPRLFNDDSQTAKITWRKMVGQPDRIIWKDTERSWHIVRYRPNICPGRLRKTGFKNENRNRNIPDYLIEMQTTQQGHPVVINFCALFFCSLLAVRQNTRVAHRQYVCSSTEENVWYKIFSMLTVPLHIPNFMQVSTVHWLPPSNRKLNIKFAWVLQMCPQTEWTLCTVRNSIRT
jgi:hypothetical protein